MDSGDRARSLSVITAAGIGGLLLVGLAGLWAYVGSDNDVQSERMVIGVALILIAVLVGAAIAIEAAKHHHHTHDDDDDDKEG